MDNNEKDKDYSPEDVKLNSPESLNETEMSNEISSASKAELEVEENKIKIISPGRMVLKRFFRSKLSVIGLVTLLILFAFSIFGPFFTGWGESDADMRIAPATTMDYEISYTEIIKSNEGILEAAKACLGTKFIAVDYNVDKSDVIASAVRNNTKLLYDLFKSEGVLSFTRADGNTIYFEITYQQNLYTIYLLDKATEATVNPITGEEIFTYSRRITEIVKRTSSSRILNLNAGPSGDHWLGTDANGYDIFTRLMYGGRISLTLGFVVVFIAGFMGIVLGGISGYFGKWVDLIIMRITDIINCLPSLPLMLIFSAILDGMEVNEGIRIYFLMGMLSLLSWTGTARLVRGQILTLREQEFMVAAEATGISVPRRIAKHLIPNIMPLLIVSMTLSLGSTILTESTLSYLGLGIREPQAAWGTMISSANDPLILQYYPNQWVPAGVMIILAVLAFNFVGDGLRDAFDPKMKR